MSAERLHTGRDYVDENGDVRHMSDLTEQDDVSSFSIPRGAMRSLGKAVKQNPRPKRQGRFEDVSGADMALAIQRAINAAQERLGRRLTDEEMIEVARDAEYKRRHGEF